MYAYISNISTGKDKICLFRLYLYTFREREYTGLPKKGWDFRDDCTEFV